MEGNSPYEDPQGRKTHSAEHLECATVQLQPTRGSLIRRLLDALGTGGSIIMEPDEEIDLKDAIDSDANELDDDAVHHDAPSLHE